MLDLDTLLGEYSVLEPSQRDDAPEETQKVWPEGHWAFADTNGITSYFGHEDDAFAFRMMKINGALNFRNMKEREPILFREEDKKSEQRDTVYDHNMLRSMAKWQFTVAPSNREFKLRDTDGWNLIDSNAAKVLGKVAKEMVEAGDIQHVRFVRTDTDNASVYIKE